MLWFECETFDQVVDHNLLSAFLNTAAPSNCIIPSEFQLKYLVFEAIQVDRWTTSQVRMCDHSQ